MKLFGMEIKRTVSSQPTRTARRIIQTPPPGGKRFAAGELDRLTASFIGSQLSINEECRRHLTRMQHRSRSLCTDNDYARKFLQMVKANVIGPAGIGLQCQFKNAQGKPDIADQDFIEGHWKKWGRRNNCTIDGKLSWLEVQNLAAETCARDGEVLIQKIRRKGDRYFLKLRVLECDHLDVTHNERLPNGRRIVMGVELDQNDRPLAYWLKDQHPGEFGTTAYVKRRRIPARDILHIFKTERPGQVRGVPWLHAAIRRLVMLGNYEEAELIAARVGASKMAFYTMPDGDGAVLSDELSPEGHDQADFDLVQEVEPGVIETLPHGYDLKTFDPTHPTAAFPDFTKAVLRGASSGLNVAYEGLSSDREGVNYSSIRSGVLEEREQWRMLQHWFADVLHHEIYSEWLELENTGGVLTALPADKLESKFMNVSWQSRGWDWVDPAKDVQSKIEEYKLGTITLTEIAAAKGKNLNDIFAQRQQEQELAKSYGIEVGQVFNQPTQKSEEKDDAEA